MRWRKPWRALRWRRDRRIPGYRGAGLPAWLTLGSLVLLLAILGWYQHRWTGMVSRAELAGMRGALATVVEAYAHDFDRELTRLALIFAGTEPGAPRREAASSGDADLVDRLTAARRRWDEEAAEPRMLGGLWVARADAGGRLSLHRFDDGTLRPTAWPAELTPARRRIESIGGSLRLGDRARVRRSIPYAPEIPALVLPVDVPRRRAEEESGEPEARPPIHRSFLILELNAVHLREVTFPRLSRRYNLGVETSSYEIAIVDDRGRRIYDSGAAPAAEAHPPDGSTRMFRFLPPPEAMAIWHELAEHTLPRRTVRRHDAAAGRRVARLMLLPGDRDAERAPWRLLAFHRQGPLDAVVSQARRRNLWVVAAGLGLLVAAVGFLIASNRRARLLALQQMDFVAAMSHELRTPLATIRSLGENLEHGVVPGNEQTRRYGAMIVRQERRLTRLVEDVLEFSGMGLAPSPRPLETVDARAVVTDAIEETRSLFAEADAELDADLPATACPVRADPEALSRALQNLLSNAVKFGGLRPSVSVRLQSAGTDGEVRIMVHDRGPGIAAEDLPRIFEPFFRSAAARAAKLPGTGLGLALVRRIVAAHDGRVEVESYPGRGTTFTVRLPRAESL